MDGQERMVGIHAHAGVVMRLKSKRVDITDRVLVVVEKSNSALRSYLTQLHSPTFKLKFVKISSNPPDCHYNIEFGSIDRPNMYNTDVEISMRMFFNIEFGSIDLPNTHVLRLPPFSRPSLPPILNYFSDVCDKYKFLPQLLSPNIVTPLADS
jgi:hypothetical protein